MGARQPLPPRRAELSGPMLGLWAKCCDLCFGSKEGSAEGGRGGAGGGGDEREIRGSSCGSGCVSCFRVMWLASFGRKELSWKGCARTKGHCVSLSAALCFAEEDLVFLGG